MRNIQLLLDINFIDFSLIKELCCYFNKIDSEDNIIFFINELTHKMQQMLDNFSQDANLTTFSVLLNYSYYLMIVLLNLKKNKNFIYSSFKKESKFVKMLMTYITTSRLYKNSNKISKVFCNLFLDEYKEIYFLHDDPEIEDLFILNNEKFSEVNVEGIDIYPKIVYQSILEQVLNFEISYENIFSCLKRNSDDIGNTNKSTSRKSKILFESQDVPLVKLLFIQSIIRVVFSKEKNSYLENTKNNFEFYFLNFVVERCLNETKQKYGDKYNSLFRKDEISEDIIKYIFYVYGNTFMIKSFGM